ncbi:aminoglycoside phosphotransferase family protein [Chengkuizengella sediminis]|uniref:aminoglycoside phosphotransferase family protein n=1 Tax=Chengkuizengella sediminis TaxID=1885917 RepID=UPI00138A0CF3|nr:hypothetical protein [Chengkuizengella sediminis]
MIDPKGLIGELEYDLIQYLNNNLPLNEDKLEIIEKRIDIFTEVLGLNKKRILLWGYCHTVLSTCWSIEDDGQYDQTFYQCVGVYETCFEKNYGIELRL